MDHPATELVAQILEDAVVWLKDIRKDVFFEGDPHRTQEVIAAMNARIEAAESLRNLLTKDGLLAEERYIEQAQRNPADRLQSIS